jgi:hypothetical protein
MPAPTSQQALLTDVVFLLLLDPALFKPAPTQINVHVN